ncbi:GtrA family protein [Pelistega suis]|uniref:GtrA family protein n=1 Tax=Pelistega suis TaxID=1631957 RepID=UPI00359C8A91
MKQFIIYSFVGVINTLLHWSVSFAVYIYFQFEQSLSNLLGFIVSVIFSYVINSKFTFKVERSFLNFISFISFMGLMSYAIGFLSDKFNLPLIFSLVFFSFISLILGFICSKYIIFS